MNKFKKNDEVIVITGKDKGKRGKIIQIFPLEQKVVVENINVLKKHVKATKDKDGGILEMAGKIHWSNVMIVSSKTDKPVKVTYKKIKDKKCRVSKKTGDLI